MGSAVSILARRSDIWENCASNSVENHYRGKLSSISVPSISAWTAHGLAWAAGIFLAFGPVYQSSSATPATPDEPGGEPTWIGSSTLVEENGLYVILLLLVPVLLTASFLSARRLTAKRQTVRRALLWGNPAVLLGFCFVAIASIGMLYLPSGLALLIAAATDTGGRAAEY